MKHGDKMIEWQASKWVDGRADGLVGTQLNELDKENNSETDCFVD